MENRCFACMNKINSIDDKCSHCGNDNSIPEFDPKRQLKPGTILRERFLVGLMLEQNGEGVTYISYDLLEKKRVRLRELFPDSLCSRTQNGEIKVNIGCEIQYKSLMVDFGELSRTLIDMKPNSCILRALMIFAMNNTLYTVYEDVAGVTLTRYLLENTGELNWDEDEIMFLPLLHAIKILNANGIIHRGISPDTIIVTKNYELKLTGICTSGARANNSEIKSELYIGYAAPEQYQKCISYGEWTDVYAISAVLYKSLTGTMPPRADLRDAVTPIISPRELNSNITQGISDAIMRGLAYNKKERTLYIKDLIGDLYASTPTVEEQQPVVAKHTYIEEKAVMSNKRNKKSGVPVWLIVILITVPIMLGLLFLAYKYILEPTSSTSSNYSSYYSSDLASQSPSSDTPVTSDTSAPSVNNIEVVDFSGQHYEDIINVEAYKAMYTFTMKEIYDENGEAGVIVGQSVPKGTIAPAGIEIELQVSKGPQYVTIPPLFDENDLPISVDAYTKYLSDNGIKSKVEHMVSDTVPSGEIINLSVEIGSTVDRESTEEITIFVAL